MAGAGAPGDAVRELDERTASSAAAQPRRNFDGTLQITDRILLGPEHFDEFCIGVPADPRIPGGGGYEQCGYYDVKPEFFTSQVLTRVSDSDKFGDYKRYSHGFTISANGRLPYGITLSGGIDAGQNTREACFTVDVPNQPRNLGDQVSVTSNTAQSPFCKQTTGLKDNLDFRLRGSVPLRYGINVSFIFRNTPGGDINTTLGASGLATAAGTPVRFVNGRTAPLTTTYTLDVTPRAENFTERFSQLDVAVSKVFELPGIGRLRTALDIYNALNANSIQGVTGAYGARYLRPTLVLDPRLLRVTASIDF